MKKKIAEDPDYQDADSINKNLVAPVPDLVEKYFQYELHEKITCQGCEHVVRKEYPETIHHCEVTQPDQISLSDLLIMSFKSDLNRNCENCLFLKILFLKPLTIKKVIFRFSPTLA